MAPLLALRSAVTLASFGGQPVLVMNLIGLGFGPTWVGAVSDWFKAAQPQHSLQLAFYTLVPFYVLAIALFLGLGRALRREERLSGGVS